jgi:hypothetical protein
MAEGTGQGRAGSQVVNAAAVIAKRSIPEPMSGCWLWTGAIASHGYGHTRFDGETWYAHRLSWHAHRGPITPGMWVLHRCDVPACVNPAHLFLGTATDNAQDRENKGRGRVKVRKAERPAVPSRVWPEWKLGVCCRRGHPWSPETTYWHQRSRGERTRGCLICKRQRERARARLVRQNKGPS